MKTTHYTNPLMQPYAPLSDEQQRTVDMYAASDEAALFRPIQQVYIDLFCLREYKLGALLLCADSPEEVQAIYAALPAYNLRVDDTFFSYFSQVKHHEDQWNEILHDPKYVDALMLKSPTTLFQNHLHVFLSQWYQYNQKVAPGTSIRVVLNTYPFVFSDALKLTYAKLFHQYHPSFRLALISDPVEAIPRDILIDTTARPAFHSMFLQDIVPWCKETSPIGRDLCEYLVFHDVHIFAPRRLDPELDTIVTDIEKTFKVTEDFLRICCEFRYMPFPVLV